MFKKKITIHSSKSKEEAIAVLAANVESWHRDSSSLIFEGNVTPEGNFKMKLGPVINGYMTKVSVTQISGNVTEGSNRKAIIEVSFSLFKNGQIFIYILPIVLPLISIFLYIKNIGNSFPWFIPLLYIPFVLGVQYIAFSADVKTAKDRLMILLG